MAAILRRVLVSAARILGASILVLVLVAGAAAWIVREPTLPAEPDLTLPRADPARLERDVRFFTTNACPRDVDHPANLDAAAKFIENELRRTGARVALEPFRARGRAYHNVVATLGPDDPCQPTLIVGAHYDAFGGRRAMPAADDNASGAAGVLELARLLAIRSPARPVMLVAFTNEEPPFFGSEKMGSAIHAASLAASHRPVVGMICLEMIGYYTRTQPWDSSILGMLYPRTGDFIAIAGGWRDRELARLVKSEIDGAGLDAVSFTGPHGWIDASDQRNYWARGWRAVMVTDTAYERNPNYHTPNDTPETLDYVRMARVVDGVFGAVDEVSR